MRTHVGAFVIALTIPALLSAQGPGQALPVDQGRPLPGFIWGPANIPANTDLKICANNLSGKEPARLLVVFYAVSDSSKPLGGKVLIMNPKQGGCILMRKDALPQVDPTNPNAIIAILAQLPRGSGATDIAGLMGPVDFAGTAKPADFVGSAQLTDSTGTQFGAILPYMEMPLDIGIVR